MSAHRYFIAGTTAGGIDPADRGLNYGDGVFETLRIAGGQPRWWPDHVQRLDRGARVLRIPMPDPGRLRTEAQTLCACVGEGVLKIVLTRGTGGRGYAPPAESQPSVILSLHPLPNPLPPLRLRWCELRLAIQPALAGIKHLNRLEQVLARAECVASGHDEGLMQDGEGRVVCATSANLFARIGGEWLTPAIDRCGVAGVARGRLLAQGFGREAALHRIDIESADAMFLCNAVHGVMPVAELAGRRWAGLPLPAALLED